MLARKTAKIPEVVKVNNYQIFKFDDDIFAKPKKIRVKKIKCDTLKAKR
jgi:hypothetical protein